MNNLFWYREEWLGLRIKYIKFHNNLKPGLQYAEMFLPTFLLPGNCPSSCRGLKNCEEWSWLMICKHTRPGPHSIEQMSGYFRSAFKIFLPPTLPLWITFCPIFNINRTYLIKNLFFKKKRLSSNNVYEVWGRFCEELGTPKMTRMSSGRRHSGEA